MKAYQTLARPAAEPALPPLAVPEAVAARLLGISPRTLWSMRREGTGPRHVMLRGSVRYAVSELHRWLAEQTAASATVIGGDA